MELKDVLKKALDGNVETLQLNKDKIKKALVNEFNSAPREIKQVLKRVIKVLDMPIYDKWIGLYYASSSSDREGFIDEIRQKIQSEVRIQGEDLEEIVELFVYAIVGKNPVIEITPQPFPESCGEVTTNESGTVLEPVKDDPLANTNEWECTCHYTNYGKYCVICGQSRNDALLRVKNNWICNCGRENFGSFCTNCGLKRPLEL